MKKKWASIDFCTGQDTSSDFIIKEHPEFHKKLMADYPDGITQLDFVKEWNEYFKTDY